MTETGVVIRILAVGIATIIIINYAFRTSRERSAAEEKIAALRVQLSNMGTKLNKADAQIATFQNRIEELTGQFASRSRIEKQSGKSIPVKEKPTPSPPPKTTRGLVTAILYTLRANNNFSFKPFIFESSEKTLYYFANTS
jgi:hypothetical protein